MKYCERCGKEFDYRHECPDCHCDENEDLFCRLAPKINKNMVECPSCGEKIYEARRHCRYCGAINPLALKDSGEGYCPACGISFVDGVCPNCGKKPSNFSYDTKPNHHATVAYYCSSCGKHHPTIYHFCIRCGNNNRSHPPRKEILEPKPVVINYKHGTYCYKCGKKFNADNECPDCFTNERYLGYKPKINDNTIKCRNCGNEIYESRRHCDCCGTKNPLADKHNGEGYCPDCGISFVDGICPDCGKKPADFKYGEYPGDTVSYHCANCGKPHRSIYHFCIKCGNNNRSHVPKTIRLKEDENTSSRQRPAYSEPKTEQKPKNSSVSDKYRESNRETVRSYASDDTYYYLNTTLWLVLGIASLIICCMPTSIGTIICSIGAKNAENYGDYALAKRKLTAAKLWFFAGAGIIAALMIASVIIQVTS